MSYRKFKADHLFTGTKILNNKHVLITKHNGEIVDIITAIDAGDDVEIFKGILSPGFINAHCHLELSHMQGLIPEKTGLVDFVFKVVTQRHCYEEEILQAIEYAEDEMIAGGIVAVADICNNLLTLSQKLKNRLQYYNFIEASGWLPSVSETRFERSLHLYNEFEHSTSGIRNPKSGIKHQTSNVKHQTSIVPHAPYSVSENLWQHITPYFENKVVSIHNQETVFEDEFFLQGTGDIVRMYELMKIDNSFHKPTKKSSVQSYFYKLSKAASVILVHNTFIQQNDIDYIKQNKPDEQLVSFCVCINANQYIENALPPVEMLVQNNCNIILGTDSLASNWSLNMLNEIKTIQKNFPSISLEKILTWATANGAKALQMDDTLGSFEKGKKPGIVLIDCLNLDYADYKIKRII